MLGLDRCVSFVDFGKTGQTAGILKGTTLRAVILLTCLQSKNKNIFGALNEI